MSKPPSLHDIFQQIPDSEIRPVNQSDPAAVVQQRFEDINTFIDEYGHVPGIKGDVDFAERQLGANLKSLANNSAFHDQLRPLDRHSLLPSTDRQEVEANPPQTLDQILEMLPEDLGPDITQLHHVRGTAANKRKPENISRRKVCDEFYKFEPLFEQVSRDLKEGVRKVIPYRREQEIREGQFFILKGVLVYIANVGDVFEKAGKKNARMRVIFGNGTEGSNLRRALSAELYKDKKSRRITSPQHKVGKPDTENAPVVASDAKVMASPEGASYSGPPAETGTIYVLRSLSKDPVIQQYGDRLIKIGVTTGTVKGRIANAAKSATYLMAPVAVVAEFTLENIHPKKLERLLHIFFSDAQAQITIKDRMGNDVTAREWFFLDVSMVKVALDHFEAGTLETVRFDPNTGRVE